MNNLEDEWRVSGATHLAAFDQDGTNNVVWVPNPSQWWYVSHILKTGVFLSQSSYSFPIYSAYRLCVSSLNRVVQLHF